MKKLCIAILCILTLTILSPAIALAASAEPYMTESTITIVSMSPALTAGGTQTITATDLSENAIVFYLTANGTQTITATKTSYYVDSNQNILWYVSVTATFSYDGTSAWCTGCSHDAQSSSGAWTIKSSSHSSSGNSATATATAMNRNNFGISREYTRSVTISCSPTGEIS